MKIQRVKYKDIEQIPQLKVRDGFKQDFQGSAPAPFIGRFGYPNVNVGILSPQYIGEMSSYDSPRVWSQRNDSIGNIASKRYSLVNSRAKCSVNKLHSLNKLQESSRFLELVQEVGMAKRAAEVEVSLKKIPTMSIKAEKEVIPFGPGSEILRAKITENVKVDSRVERVVDDIDLKSNLGILNLYKKGFEENTLMKLLSVGSLGLKKNRKLVPTRWSITATDDTIGKQLISEIKDYPVGSNYQAYFGGSWGNYYLLLYFPEVWSYELFETYLDQKINPWSKSGYAYSTDYENYGGRKNYAEETAGGYYAARLPILEMMKGSKRQYSCLALRFISSEYNVPLGVWVCREATRKSVSSAPISFNSEKLMFDYATGLIQRKFSFDISLLLRESKFLLQKKQQKRLTDF
mgnify:CR=1 FL=1|jgi:DNA repair protein NreA